MKICICKRVSVIIFFLLGLVFWDSACAESLPQDALPYLLYPPSTVVVENNPQRGEGFSFLLCTLRTKISQDQVLAFYRNRLLTQGYKEKKNGQEHLYIFEKGYLNTVMLRFIPYNTVPNPTLYLFYDRRIDYAFSLSDEFTKPQRVGFMPLYPRMSQYSLMQRPSLTAGIYLGFGSVDEIVSFYRDHMPAYNWRLKDSQHYQGKCHLFTALAFGDGHSNALKPEELKELLPDAEVNIQASALIFEQEGSGREDKKCYLQIIQFRDSPSVLKEKRIVNPGLLKKYGNALISFNIREGKSETIADSAQGEH